MSFYSEATHVTSSQQSTRQWSYTFADSGDICCHRASWCQCYKELIHCALGDLDAILKFNLQSCFADWYRLVSNIRHTSNIRRTPTLGNSQLEFSPTISLAKTSNTRRTPSFDFWVSIVDKVRSRPTWSELLRVAWDFDSPWITGSMAAHQSVAYVRHIISPPTANLCTLSAIVFFPIKAWMWRHLRRYSDGSAILFWLSRDPYDPYDPRFHNASRRKLCGIKRHFDKITSVCDKLSISNYIFQA